MEAGAASTTPAAGEALDESSSRSGEKYGASLAELSLTLAYNVRKLRSPPQALAAVLQEHVQWFCAILTVLRC